jgi:hypothetical protein
MAKSTEKSAIRIALQIKQEETGLIKHQIFLKKWKIHQSNFCFPRTNGRKQENKTKQY